MKRVFARLMVAVIVLTMFAGCGGEKVEKELSPIEKARARAVEIGEQYLNFEITGAEAQARLEAIKVPGDESTRHHDSLRITINLLAYKVGSPWSTYDEIEELVNDLATRDYSD